MTEPTAQQNMQRSHQAHCNPDRKISIDNMRGYRFAEVALFSGTSEENAIADFYNSTGVDDPTPARFAAGWVMPVLGRSVRRGHLRRAVPAGHVR